MIPYSNAARRYSLQGTIDPGGTVLYQTPTTRSAIITGMIITNPTLGYDLTLNKFSSYQNLSQDIYQLTGLAAGDSITDNFAYLLEPGDNLNATSSAAGTTYIINILEYTDNGSN